ncbi:MAG: DUF2683 family protein [Pedobacter sp.]|uniref:DUF2683 family protein n=1 Tax=Pedobacter sp. TaxID=1411316 RepID=UPI0035656172
MESIVIHPESNEQLKTIKAVLKALKVQFEAQQTPSLPDHLMKSATKSIKQYEAGQTMSFNEFADKHFINK